MAAASFTVVRSRAIPLLLPNIDTDVIIRVDRMMSTDPGTLAQWAFESIRYDANGIPKESCVLNSPQFVGSEILLVGENFGCGSSREPAVWAVMGLGVRCVVAPSFGDIFAANCLTNGLLPVSLSDDAVRRLAEEASRCEEIEVDLPSQVVRVGSSSWEFEIGRLHKLMLIDALDEMSLALRHLEGVEQWETRDRYGRSWAWQQRLRNEDDLQNEEGNGEVQRVKQRGSD